MKGNLTVASMAGRGKGEKLRETDWHSTRCARYKTIAHEWHAASLKDVCHHKTVILSTEMYLQSM